MREQAEKLGKALAALRQIAAKTQDVATKKTANDTLREIADYGKDAKDL